MNIEKTEKDLADKETANNVRSKKLQRQKKIDKFFDKLEVFFDKTKNILIKLCWPFYPENLKWTFMLMFVLSLCFALLSEYASLSYLLPVGGVLFFSSIIYFVYAIRKYFKQRKIRKIYGYSEEPEPIKQKPKKVSSKKYKQSSIHQDEKFDVQNRLSYLEAWKEFEFYAQQINNFTMSQINQQGIGIKRIDDVAIKLDLTEKEVKLLHDIRIERNSYAHSTDRSPSRMYLTSKQTTDFQKIIDKIVNSGLLEQ